MNKTDYSEKKHSPAMLGTHSSPQQTDKLDRLKGS